MPGTGRWTSDDASLEARLPGPLRQFLELYGASRFWDSHEALEEAWRRSGSDFYQGLILLCQRMGSLGAEERSRCAGSAQQNLGASGRLSSRLPRARRCRTACPLPCGTAGGGREPRWLARPCHGHAALPRRESPPGRRGGAWGVNTSACLALSSALLAGATHWPALRQLAFQNPERDSPCGLSRSFSNARLRICLMRSRVTPRSDPITSRVLGSPSSRP